MQKVECISDCGFGGGPYPGPSFEAIDPDEIEHCVYCPELPSTRRCAECGKSICDECANGGLCLNCQHDRDEAAVLSAYDIRMAIREVRHGGQHYLQGTMAGRNDEAFQRAFIEQKAVNEALLALCRIIEERTGIDVYEQSNKKAVL